MGWSTRTRLVVALLLHAVPIPISLLLIDVGRNLLLRRLTNSPPSYSEEPYTLELWMILLALGTVMLWGVGYLVVAGHRRNFGTALRRSLGINGTFLVPYAFLMIFVIVEGVRYGPWPAGPFRILESLAAIWWGLLNLVAVGITMWHTWRLAHEQTGHGRAQQETTA
jgi:hypothetical protein